MAMAMRRSELSAYLPALLLGEKLLMKKATELPLMSEMRIPLSAPDIDEDDIAAVVRVLAQFAAESGPGPWRV